MCTQGICQPSIDQHYQSACGQVSVNIWNEYWPICQPAAEHWLPLDSVIHMSDNIQSTPHQYFANTPPTHGQYFTDTRLTLRSFGQLLLLSFMRSPWLLAISSLLKYQITFSSFLKGTFGGRRPFLTFQASNIHLYQRLFFQVMFCFGHPSYILQTN